MESLFVEWDSVTYFIYSLFFTDCPDETTALSLVFCTVYFSVDESLTESWNFTLEV